MPDAKRCTCCNTPLVNKRSHSKTCGTNCRSKLYRDRQRALKANVSVKLIFKMADFNAFKQEAELDGILVNALLARKIHNHSNQYQAI
jgi:predicted nucleic acid-binding Zn ribbon protein